MGYKEVSWNEFPNASRLIGAMIGFRHTFRQYKVLYNNTSCTAYINIVSEYFLEGNSEIPVVAFGLEHPSHIYSPNYWVPFFEGNNAPKEIILNKKERSPFRSLFGTFKLGLAGSDDVIWGPSISISLQEHR